MNMSKIGIIKPILIRSKNVVTKVRKKIINNELKSFCFNG